MIELTERQLRILSRHDIPATSVFDARGMKPRHYKPIMDEEEKLFVINASQCFRCGPSIKTKAGHCIECRPANVAYIKRHYSAAWVYIAGSRKGGFLKLGSSSLPQTRLSLLNQRGYGKVADWRLLSYIKCENAGHIEFEMHRDLASYAVSRSYWREGNEVQCREIFSCPFTLARDALRRALGDSGSSQIWEDTLATTY